VPAALLAERDELASKRDALRIELERAKSELEALRHRRKNRPA